MKTEIQFYKLFT